METLRQQMEDARQAGKRELFLKLKAQEADEQQKEVQARHRAQVEAAKKDFPIGSVVMGRTVEKIEDGCGTERGWVSISLAGETKKYTPAELRQELYKRKEHARVNALAPGGEHALAALQAGDQFVARPHHVRLVARHVGAQRLQFSLVERTKRRGERTDHRQAGKTRDQPGAQRVGDPRCASVEIVLEACRASGVAAATPYHHQRRPGTDLL
jgi:hypothetical protein